MKPLDFINSPKEDFERHVLVCKLHIALMERKGKSITEFTREEINLINMVDDILINVIPTNINEIQTNS